MPVRNRLAAEAGTLLDDEIAPGSIESRRSQLDSEHVVELEGWARELADLTGESIPSFDPRSGGAHARVLVLREEPRCLAGEGSGFVSIDNNDLAAQHTSLAYAASGLDYANAVHWNVVPWWIRNPAMTTTTGLRTVLAQTRRVRGEMRRMLELLPEVKVVLLLGKEAERAWRTIEARGLVVLTAPHPSPLAWHQTSVSGVRNSALTLKAFSRAAEVVA
jgi:hypothetical protein